MKYNDNGEWKDIQIKVANAIQNEYGESNNDGYSQNYLNGLNEYSTTEHRVGTWIDGKPLYIRVIENSNITTDGTQVVLATISNIKDCFIENASLINSSTGYTVQMGQYAPLTPNQGYRIWVDANVGQIKYQISNAPTGVDKIRVIIKYTKTTDTSSTRSIPETRNIVVDDNDDEGEIVRGEET